MATETVDPRFRDIDAWDTASAIEAMWEGQISAIAALRQALPAITDAANAAAERLRIGRGRLIYAGAGTSGRVAVQDGAELPPTFDWPQERISFLMAGGDGAFTRSIEGAEDDVADAKARVDLLATGSADVLIGVAASGSTPFTLAAINQAALTGALTIGIANNALTPILSASTHPILLPTGSELVAGSTRMKAGTAQKAVLNLLSTAIMLRLGRVYQGRMVHMRPNNLKLEARAERMVAELASCDLETAKRALALASGDVKSAILIAMGHDPDRAAAALAAHGGNLRNALKDLS
jgi:N-acetylmuramic acid 6-phosphate etherase